jgi:Domain of unknown function (DU1801)
MGKPVEIKTKQNEASVKEFIENVADEQKRRDSLVVLDLMKNATGEDPRMWGSSIIGFGSHRYKSPTTGREVEWFVIGFSPRKANLSLYFLDIKSHAAALEKLGRHKTGSGCLYINKLDDIDIEVLKTIIQASTRNT